MQRKKYIFAISIILVLAVAGCAANISGGTTTTAKGATTTTSNVTTTAAPTTTTTTPPMTALAEKVSRFSVDADNIFYLTSDSPAKLYKIAKTGGAPAELASDLGTDSRNLGQDSTHLYFTHQGSLGVKLSRVPKAGGALEDIYSCTPGTSGSIFTDENYIYVFPYSGTFCRLLKTNLVSDGNFRAIVTDAGPNIAIWNQSIFYADSTWIKKVPKVGKFEVGILIADTAISNIILDGSLVYWVSKNTGLYKIGTDGKGKALMLASVLAKHIAQDASNIYFIESDNSIKKIAKAGGAGILVEKLGAEGTDLFADSSGIYWIEGGKLKWKKI